ncbi:hypothetical protein I314_05625 [Cryptococcus bacillisporus CA1873]|uniref:Major facilitator superfamily (MFS) profile domain-containing protein n=1 Tax=Cryptococcus bacillisporus CA1873 TaxID=1296111 RepID=A0ABR5B464_CRYGA|nr:hypothetical protein I314_05625 [Cryptococcus bacillisporus CA1873]|eukprot:KIR58382.1 hypothetical protein I314_05625 [Cryptococcus gattii CA1873]
MSNHARLHSIHGRTRSHDRRMDSLLATQSIVTSLLPAGIFFGALLQSLTSDRLGRRGSIIFWSTIFSIGIIIQVTSFGLAQITVGRFVAGLGVGALSAIVPLYAGEVALKELPGALFVLYQVQIARIRFLLGLHRRPWNTPLQVFSFMAYPYWSSAYLGCIPHCRRLLPRITTSSVR